MAKRKQQFVTVRALKKVQRDYEDVRASWSNARARADTMSDAYDAALKRAQYAEEQWRALEDQKKEQDAVYEQQRAELSKLRHIVFAVKVMVGQTQVGQ